MLEFIRDYFAYVWSIFFKQEEPNIPETNPTQNEAQNLGTTDTSSVPKIEKPKEAEEFNNQFNTEALNKSKSEPQSIPKFPIANKDTNSFVSTEKNSVPENFSNNLLQKNPTEINQNKISEKELSKSFIEKEQPAVQTRIDPPANSAIIYQNSANNLQKTNGKLEIESEEEIEEDESEQIEEDNFEKPENYKTTEIKDTNKNNISNLNEIIKTEKSKPEEEVEQSEEEEEEEEIEIPLSEEELKDLNTAFKFGNKIENFKNVNKYILEEDSGSEEEEPQIAVQTLTISNNIPTEKDKSKGLNVSKMATKDGNSQALVPTDSASVQNQLIPKLKGGSGTVKAFEEDSAMQEKHKQVVKNEGNKHIVQKGSSVSKEDNKRSAEASVKTFNEGGVKRTVQTTVVTSSSSFEQEESFEEHTTSGPIKCIKEGPIKCIKEK